MKKYKRDEIARIVLKTLLAVGMLSVAIMAPNALQIFKYFGPKNTQDRARIKRSLTHLEQHGFIRHGQAPDSFILTPKGKQKALRCRIEEIKIRPQKRWDGKWRLIMFDVPEEKRRGRRAVNTMLKQLGCIRYQKSVFITPFPCKEEVDFVGNYFGIRNHIRLVLADAVEGVDDLKKIFGINA